jgi:hypothetical protein
MNRKLATTVVLSAVLLICLPARAATTGSGVVVITQADVTKGSIPGTSGTSGFPVTITHPGSYQLGSNLVVPDGVDGIDINAPDVTLDLNGFTIHGAVTCTGIGSTLFCGFPANGANPILSGSGIVSSKANVIVRNGTVRGFWNLGVFLLGEDSVINSVNASENTQGGLETNAGLIVSCTANRNGSTNSFGFGIFAEASQVKGSTANGNSWSGFLLESSGATDSVAVGNSSFGYSGLLSLVSNSVSAGNASDMQNLGGLITVNNSCSGSLC